MDKFLEEFNSELISCRKCSRLVDFREKIGMEKRRQYQDWDYWAKPVLGIGDPKAKLLMLGLAPAAHGGNRTGRVFTGDKSAEFLFKCLHAVGIASLPNSLDRDDGMTIHDGYLTTAMKCVPPGDKPTAEELGNCAHFLQREFETLSELKVVLALGKIAFDAYIKYVNSFFPLKKKDYPFGHDVQYLMPDGKILWGCYHPSPRNVNTGRIDKGRMVDLLEKVKKEIQK